MSANRRISNRTRIAITATAAGLTVAGVLGAVLTEASATATGPTVNGSQGSGGVGDGRPTAGSSDWVAFSGGKLAYRSDAQGNRVPDFSSVGYHGGDQAIPDVPVVDTLSPAASGDDTARIQAAIEHASNGAVLLVARESGRYRRD